MKNTKEAALKELTAEEIDQVNGGINGYEGAGAIMAVVGFGSLFTPIGPIMAGIVIGSAGGGWRYRNFLLVSCPRNNFRYFIDFADDGIGSRHPGKWCGGLIVMIDKAFDSGNQFADVSERASPKSPLGDESEPAFHLIEPRRIGGRVMQMIAWPFRQPGFYLRAFMRGIVVHHQVDIQVLRDVLVDVPQKA